MKKETILQNQIMVELSKRGCKVHRTNHGLFYTPYGERITIGVEGQSDLQGHRSPDGKCFYIEVKVDKGKPKPEQIAFLEAMKKSGALAGLAWSIEDAINIVFPKE